MPSRILLDAARQGVHIYLNGSELAYKAPKGALTPALRDEIVKNKTKLIELLQAHQRSQVEMPRVPLRPDRDAPAPLSFAQLRLWVLSQIDGATAHYNMPNALWLEGRLNLDALQFAFKTIVNRHEVLRTCIRADDEGQAWQHIQTGDTFRIEQRDLSGLDGDAAAQQLKALIEAESQHQFDLANDPMIRVVVAKMRYDQHVLIATLHHIASDGWSMGVLIKEWCTFYTAFVNDEENPLPTPAIQYADYAAWQNDWMKGPVFDSQMAYWEKQLKGLPVSHQMPLDRPRPLVQGFVGNTVNQILSSGLRDDLNALCQDEGATLYIGLHAALSILIHRYSNESDIVIGVPTANREQPEIAGLIGFFVNTLVLRTDLSGNPDFRTVLRKSKATLADAYAHQQVPFEKIVERIQPERTLAHHPLFQIVLVMQNTQEGAIALPDLMLKPLQDQSSMSKYDLLVNVSEDNGKLSVRWEYNVDLFDVGTIERLSENFQSLLGLLLKEPQKGVLHHDFVSLPERQCLSLDGSEELASHPVSQCLHERFEACAMQTPNAVALVCEERSMTYAELNRAANRLAHYLLDAERVQPGSLIGLHVCRSMEMLVGMLAILKAGAAYLPLDPDYPASRLAFMCSDAGATTVLSNVPCDFLADAKQVNLIRMDDPSFETLMMRQSDENIDRQRLGVTPDNLAYVIYTSGSTGNPKGVMVPHRNVMRLFASAQRHFEFHGDDVWTLFHSYAFDFSVWEIWGALLYGGKLVVVPRWVSRSFDDFFDLVSQQGVTVLNQTPSAFYQFIAADKGSTLSLRYVVFGGEALNLTALEPWFARRGDDAPELINMYGITETTVHVTYRRIMKSDLSAMGSASVIGRPLDDLGVSVLNSEGISAPVGVAGEMYVKGRGLAIGYLNQPELTAQRFVEREASDGRRERFYRSGDLARWLASGELEYLGRIDHQVKIRGFRIELGEVEASVLKMPEVAEAAVIATKQNNALVAYIVPHDQAYLLEDRYRDFTNKVRSFLATTLPDYMIPAHIVLLNRFPLTDNGKLDRKTLPEPRSVSLAATSTPARTDTERQLCAIWKHVLDIENVGIDDNFFSVGGDSILAIKVVAQARHHDLQFSVKELFHCQTIKALATLVETRSVQNDELIACDPFALLTEFEKTKLQSAIESDAIEDAFPLTVLQQGMVFHHQIAYEQGIYHDIFGYRIQVSWNFTQFENALHRLVHANEMLRSHIIAGEGRLLHAIQTEIVLPLEYVDFRELDEMKQHANLSAWLAKEKSSEFRADRPMWRIVVHHLRQNSFHYSLSFHHALLDGWSVANFNAQLIALFTGKQEGTDETAQPLPFRYTVAEELRNLESSDAKRFWSGHLTQAETPWWTGRRKSARVLVENWNVGMERASAILELSQRLGVQEKSIWLALHFAVLAAINGKAGVTSSVVFNVRPERVGSEKTLGLFLNSLPLHVANASAPWNQLIATIDAALLNMTEFRNYPVANIQLDSGLDFSGALFNYTNFNVYDDFSGDALIEGSEGFEDTNYTYSLSCSRNTSAKSCVLTLTVDADIFDRAFVQRIEGYFFNAIDSLLVHDDGGASRNLLIGEREREHLLRTLNATERSYPSDACVHELFEVQVKAQPDALAVRCGTTRLSYHELNTRANQLAHFLVNARSIEVGDLVGICLVRSVDMLVAILAVLKAGATYVPLDVDYPVSRLKYMIEDAGVVSILTTEALQSKLPILGVNAICLDAVDVIAQVAKNDVNNLVFDQVAVTSGHLAYTIYTSGSTGNPKGVSIFHRGVVNYLSYVAREYFATVSGAVASSSLAFDATVTSILGPLAAGKYVHLVPQDGREIEHLAEVLKSTEEVLLFKITPAHLESLAYRFHDEHARDLAHWFIVGGEQLTSDLAAQWKMRILPSCVIVNEYGPTETVVGCSTYFLRAAEDIHQQRAAVSIGTPIDNTQLYVVGSDGELVPFGVPGELWIGGDGVARDYLNRADITASKFAINTFGADGSRIYKTGDLVRWLPENQMEFLGRLDHQVKIRGYRIELGEIEACLRSHENVEEALVIARNYGAGDSRLIAYVVANQHDADQLSSDLVTRLKHHLAQQLPEFMVPSAIAQLDAFPLTENGKIDRKRLPEPQAVNEPRTVVAPRTETERILCKVWQEILRVDTVGITDNFFEIGGHSLLAMKLITAIETRFDVSLNVKLMFETSNLQELAAYIDVTSGAAKDSQGVDDMTDSTQEMEFFQL